MPNSEELIALEENMVFKHTEYGFCVVTRIKITEECLDMNPSTSTVYSYTFMKITKNGNTKGTETERSFYNPIGIPVENYFGEARIIQKFDLKNINLFKNKKRLLNNDS